MAEWRENDAQWYEERMLHCATCGRMIAKRYLSDVGRLAKRRSIAARSAPSSTTTTCSSSGGLTISHHQTSARRMRS